MDMDQVNSDLQESSVRKGEVPWTHSQPARGKYHPTKPGGRPFIDCQQNTSQKRVGLGSSSESCCFLLSPLFPPCRSP